MERIKLDDFLKLSKDVIKGKVIVFPTDTVYGVGAMIDDQEAIERIYAMKMRDHDKPLANLCSSVEQIEKYVTEIPQIAIDLINKFWPGALTIIFKKNDKYEVKNTYGTIGFRMPNSKIALAILDRFSIFATTSVNLSGQKELNTIEEIEKEFQYKIDYLIIDEQKLSSVPSTVVDVSTNEIKVLRKGNINV